MHPDKRRAGRRIRKQRRMRRALYDLSRRIPVGFAGASVAMLAFSGAIRTAAEQQELFARQAAREPWHHDYRSVQQ